jgi:hypothetical protein
MSLSISKRKLTDSEIDLVVNEMRDFPDVGLYTKNQWNKFEHSFIAMKEKDFIGVCVTIPLLNWIKIGPVIILKTYQGKGNGRQLLTQVISDNSHSNLYIGSSNRKVGTIVESLKFQRVNSFFQLPSEIKIYVVKHFFQRINYEFLLDSFPKLFKKSGEYKYFIKYK